MIKSLTVVNHLNNSIKIELSKPIKTGFLINHIDGIGLGKANINTSEQASGDGGNWLSSRLPVRNITLGITFYDAKETIEQLRHKSYEFFPVKKQIKLIFETDERTSEIYGYVESNEPSIFSEKEASEISIICPDVYFIGCNEQITYFSATNPKFEFPFSNESLLENKLIFSEFVKDYTKTIYYDGDIDTGFVMRFHIPGAVNNIAVYNVGTDEKIAINLSFKKGDELTISTVHGNKTAFLTRDGNVYNVVGFIERNPKPDWLELRPGPNILYFSSDGGSENINLTILNKVLYGGV